MPTLVDTNILIDLLDRGSPWSTWSATRIADAAARGSLVINPIIFAEIAGSFEDGSKLDESLPPHFFKREDLPWPAARRAGHAFTAYRKRGGARDRVLPDFLIGAHAAEAGYELLTRDPARYRSYFPALVLIAPDSHP